MRQTVEHSTSVDGMSVGVLADGFFEGWDAAPSREQHLQLLAEATTGLWRPTASRWSRSPRPRAMRPVRYIPLLEVLPQYRVPMGVRVAPPNRRPRGHGGRVRRRAGALAVVVGIASASCGDDSRGDPHAATESTPAASSASTPDAGSGTDLPESIQRISGRLRCDTVVPSTVGAPEGPLPAEAYDCAIGDANLSLFTYANEAARARAFAGLVARCAPAVSAADWIVWTNTNEAAAAAHAKLGGNLSLFREPC